MNVDSNHRLLTARSRFDQLVEETSRPDWDDEGAVSIAPEQWERARHLVVVVASEVTRAPEVYVSAGSDGTIHFRWSDAARCVDAEMDGNTFYWFTTSPHGSTRGESPHGSDVVRAVRDVFA
jgi:hypothetical protein